MRIPLLESRPAPAPRSPAVSADNTDGPGAGDAAAVRDFLAELAAAHVGERTARLYVGHLGRFAAWLGAEGGGGLLGATGADVRAYRARLAARQQPASVNGALAALRRFYGWAHGAGRVGSDPTAKVRPAAQQPLAPKGFPPWSGAAWWRRPSGRGRWPPPWSPRCCTPGCGWRSWSA